MAKEYKQASILLPFLRRNKLAKMVSPKETSHLSPHLHFLQQSNEKDRYWSEKEECRGKSEGSGNL